MSERREVWVEARDCPRFKVSNLGRVLNTRTDEIVPQYLVNDRWFVGLQDRYGFAKTIPLSRLVALSFFDCEDGEGLEVDHRDGNRRNNELWNLDIVTRKENRDRGVTMGLIQKATQVLNLETGEVYSSLNEAGQKLGYISSLMVPRSARESGAVFVRRGVRLKLVESDD